MPPKPKKGAFLQSKAAPPIAHIALVGLMGVGKTTIGRRLAKRLAREFFDSDDEIEAASGRTVAGYFRDHGEPAFRDGELRVVTRLVQGDVPIILATGGGAFIHPPTREILKSEALTIWLKCDFETVMERVTRKDTRPLLQVEDPRAKMLELMDARYPIYAEADIHVNVSKGPHIRTVNRVLRAITAHQRAQTKKAANA